MVAIEKVAELRRLLASHRSAGASIGFIPTIGALHEGHLTLIRCAKGENDIAVVSIFVNPTQFGPGEDFDRYPRDPVGDANLAESAGADVLFTPTVVEIYPMGPAVAVHVEGLSDRWEGERRPGHFDGVATVCAKLFNILQADRAYFGLKDYQQLRVIQRMVQALHIPLKMVSTPTVREPD